MKITIAGGTGFIGTSLVDELMKCHELCVISRDKNKARKLFPKVKVIDWEINGLRNELNKTDLVINLVGKSIGDNRWSKQVKQQIINSRVEPAKILCDIISEIDEQSRPRLFNASAIGVYGIQPEVQLQKDTIYTEDSPIPREPKDFLSEVGMRWESIIDQYKTLNAVKLRFGVVLSPKGGMLKKVLLPYKIGLGGRIGSGNQPFSWIAIEDLIGAISYLIDHPEIAGAINLVAPEVVSQMDFAKTLAIRLKRPSFVPMPSIMVKCLFGQMGKELLLGGQSVRTKRLDEYNFQFKTLASAIEHWAF